jgi:hypothetical protein
MMDENEEMTTEEKSWLFSEDVEPETESNNVPVDIKPDTFGTTGFTDSRSIPLAAEIKLEEKPEVMKAEGETKGEENAEVDVKDLFSGSTPPPDIPHSHSRSRSASHDTKEAIVHAQEEESKPRGPILIDDLPTAWDEAHETFVTLEKCVYERKDMGLSRESDEMMVCDCSYDKRESASLHILVGCLGGVARRRGI